MDKMRHLSNFQKTPAAGWPRIPTGAVESVGQDQMTALLPLHLGSAVAGRNSCSHSIFDGLCTAINVSIQRKLKHHSDTMKPGALETAVRPGDTWYLE